METSTSTEYINDALTRWLSPAQPVNFTITIDRLILTLKWLKHSTFKKGIIEYNYQHTADNTFFINDGLALKPNYSKISSVYTNLYNVLLQNQVIGYLSTGNKRDKTLVEFEYDKHVLYTEDFYKYKNILTDSLPLKYHNINYVEIALDTNHPIRDIYKTVYAKSTNWDMKKGEYQFLNKVTVDPMKDGRGFIIVENKLPITQPDTSKKKKTRTKEIAIYHKTNYEDYIQEFHRNNGLDTENIHRVEARLCNRYLKDHKITLEDLTDPDVQHSLLLTAVGINLTVKDLASERRDHNRKKKYDHYNLLEFAAGNVPIINRIKRNKSSVSNTKRNEWIYIKESLHDYIQSGKEIFFKNILFKYEQFQREDYTELHYKLTKYVKEYDKHVTDKIIEKINSLLTVKPMEKEKKQPAMPHKINFFVNDPLMDYLKDMTLLQNKTISTVIREAITEKYIRHLDDLSLDFSSISEGNQTLH